MTTKRSKRPSARGHVSKRAIWAYVSAHPGCTDGQIARATGLSRSTVHYHVRSLVATGVLVANLKPNGVQRKGGLRASVPLLRVAAESEG